ncbi:hypothetical protein [Methylobacterium oxalidis]|uniref:Uncharacterized protein n=1 Tax=Methylobacterium oxalidis TaxID=944322 RepID=A0A512JC88_9HYPH|nr:hypothetical protein [Methylobacterium oxalidis]GEP07525.1 hypothetical protein MOX02_55630 [Methylobacterium oxalidis]GLS65769.1 hypothetical protein GCM10007888_41510 [Methylobacterium oxalidis]
MLNTSSSRELRDELAEILAGMDENIRFETALRARLTAVVALLETGGSQAEAHSVPFLSADAESAVRGAERQERDPFSAISAPTERAALRIIAAEPFMPLDQVAERVRELIPGARTTGRSISSYLRDARRDFIKRRLLPKNRLTGRN